ncbi:rCG62647 [Rattus norvegicus]|uniref:RCG62647 n=1 Tax=Rattus norvegicus TaxID=10116 RepID=A6J5N1_RAT|nr:rCG62647 [Rattus norvegicus]
MQKTTPPDTADRLRVVQRSCRSLVCTTEEVSAFGEVLLTRSQTHEHPAQGGGSSRDISARGQKKMSDPHNPELQTTVKPNLDPARAARAHNC